LIAEKLFALEAGENNASIMNKNVQAYLKGRREQAMREILLKKEAYEIVQLDTALILNTIENSWRTYSICFANFNQLSSAKEFIEFVPVLDTLNADKESVNYAKEIMSKRSVSWDEAEHDSVLQVLFSGRVEIGKAVGPIKIDLDNYLVLYVNGWSVNPLASSQQFERRWQDVAGYHTRKIAQRNYREIEKKLMHGKSIIFERNTFYDFIKALAPLYIDSNDDNIMNLGIMHHTENASEYSNSNIKGGLEKLKDKKLFNLNNKPWTVQMLIDLLKSRPLVFRSDRIPKQEFGEQLKLAIIDVITDHYLTQKAYESHYDNEPYVKRVEIMWKDHINALYEKDRLLRNYMVDSSRTSNYIQLVETYLNPVVDSLQNAYSEIIEIDMDLFKSISISRIDMLAVQDYMPYPVTTPSFPLLTNDHILDYGTRTNTEQ